MNDLNDFRWLERDRKYSPEMRSALHASRVSRRLLAAGEWLRLCDAIRNIDDAYLKIPAMEAGSFRHLVDEEIATAKVEASWTAMADAFAEVSL